MPCGIIFYYYGLERAQAVDKGVRGYENSFISSKFAQNGALQILAIYW